MRDESSLARSADKRTPELVLISPRSLTYQHRRSIGGASPKTAFFLVSARGHIQQDSAEDFSFQRMSARIFYLSSRKT